MLIKYFLITMQTQSQGPRKIHKQEENPNIYLPSVVQKSFPNPSSISPSSQSLHQQLNSATQPPVAYTSFHCKYFPWIIK